MRRVVILGSSGAGKSTYARALGEKLGLPVVHHDALFWRPGWVEPDPEPFRAAVAAAIAGDAWITDGNYVSRTFDLRLPRADAVIFLHQPRWLCVARILSRWIFAFGRRRPDMAEGCDENFSWDFFLWTWNFQAIHAPRILKAAEAFPTTVTHLRGGAAIARFLAQAR